ncbi:transcriptional regulator [Spongiivirga citrea]|uniref:Tetratricopeptide repeat protein n=1 Tax=Spongiivirga citrea TaxID=1481457 RepID=A0A6M0CVE7_9FLAO|nr:transcriptional regulator [Spongiivirga citrea]NER17750.1 tetratricopeptide repeat protein [Spongiivirga citrea]
MKPKSILVILLTSFFWCVSYAQETTILDSLITQYTSQKDGIEKVETLEEIYKEVFFTKTPKDALPYAKEQLKISREIGYKIGNGYALHNIGNYYRRTHVFDSAKFYFNKAKKIWLETKSKEGLFKTLNSLAKIEQLSGNFTSAITMYDSVIQIAKEMKSGIRISGTNREIATIYMDKGSYELGVKYMLDGLKGLDSLPKSYPDKKADMLVGMGRIESLRGNDEAALEPLNKGLEIFKSRENHLWQCITYTEIGYAHLNLGDYDESIYNFNESLKIAIDRGRTGFEGICYYNLGLANRKKGNLDKAEEFLLKSVSMGGTSANNNVSTLNEFGNLYFDQKKYDKAINSSSRAIFMADSIGSLAELKDGYELRGKAYEKKGLFLKALQDKKKFMKLNDSLFNKTKSKQIEELKTIYETEKKEQEIALQKNEIALLEQKAEIDNLQKILLGGGLVLSVLLFGLGFYGIRQKMKRNKLEREKLNAELAFKKKELTTHALHLAKKNETLEGLKQKAQELTSTENGHGFKQLIRSIDFDLQDDNNWENFARYFEEVHKDFNGNVKSKYPQVTSNELRLLALLKMNLSSKEIANILNISQEGIKKARYRLRKKLELQTEDSLQELAMAL